MIIVEDLYNRCVKAGYVGSLDQFVCELENIDSNEPKEISEEYITGISGGLGSLRNFGAGVLSLITLGMSTGFASGLGSNLSSNERNVSMSKLQNLGARQDRWLINNNSSKNNNSFKNTLLKVLGVSTLIGLPIATSIVVYKIKTAEKFEDALKEFNKSVDELGENYKDEDINGIMAVFQEQIVKEFKKRKIDINTWIGHSRTYHDVKGNLENLVRGLSILKTKFTEGGDILTKNNINECIQKLNDLISKKSNKQHNQEHNQKNKDYKDYKWYTYDVASNTVTIEGAERFPKTIYNAKMKELQKELELTSDNKVNLVFKNCVIRNNACSNCEFINNIQIDSGTKCESRSFYSSNVNNLLLKKGAIVQKYVFEKADINVLQAEEEIEIPEGTFERAKIGSAKYINGNSGSRNIMYGILNQWGVASDMPKDQIDDFCDRYLAYNADTNTVTIDGKNDSLKLLPNMKIGDILKEKYLKSEEKINLVLKRCIVESRIMSELKFIGDLTIDSGTEFVGSAPAFMTLDNLLLKNGASFRGNNFGFCTVNTLQVENGVNIKTQAFLQTTIIDSAKYCNDGGNDTGDIPYETLEQWGVHCIPKKQIDKYSTYDEKTNTLTIDGKKSSNDGKFKLHYLSPIVDFYKEKCQKLDKVKLKFVLQNCTLGGDTFDYYGSREVSELTIGKKVNFDNNYILSDLKVSKLNIDSNIKLDKDCFNGLLISDSAKIINTSDSKVEAEDIPYNKLKYWGVVSVPQTQMDQYYDLFLTCNKDTNTVTIDGSKCNVKDRKVTKTVVDVLKRKYLSKESKVNLVLKDCIVKEKAFEDCKFIDDLTIGSNTHVCERGFLLAGGINNILVNKKCTIKRGGLSLIEYKGKIKYIDGDTVESENRDLWTAS